MDLAISPSWSPQYFPLTLEYQSEYLPSPHPHGTATTAAAAAAAAEPTSTNTPPEYPVQTKRAGSRNGNGDGNAPSKVTKRRKGSAAAASSGASKPLACTACRRKKVKCFPTPDGRPCRLCLKVGAECTYPAIDERKLSNSRKLIGQLYERISALESELRSHRCPPNPTGPAPGTDDWLEQQQQILVPSLPMDPALTAAGGQDTGVETGNGVQTDAIAVSSGRQGRSKEQQHPDSGIHSPGSTASAGTSSSGSDNMIVRLCGGQRQLNSDRVGRLRFFGPTSSLHLSESVTSSVLMIREPGAGGGRGTSGSGSRRWQWQWQDTLPEELQTHLMDTYWRYQHHVIPIMHKEAFLHDLDTGQTKHCSKLLVYCMLTRAAAISDHAEIRALAVAEDDTNEDPPFLVRKCASLLDAELNNPGITTLQSLQLLSEIYCVISNDTKGWLDAGGACRLAFELGLHSDSRGLGSTNLSQVDLEIRQIAFWSCFSMDRQWALYLGRPQMIKLDDVTTRRPECEPSTSSYEMRLSAVWANLLEIVGVICDALNGVQTTKHRVTSLDGKLREWHSTLDSCFQFTSQQTPAIFLLHMQYSAAAILLHRPLASFGNSPSSPTSAASAISRQICVHHACLIAQYLRQYRDYHGGAHTMSWIALHMIATASTTLIASVAENGNTVVVASTNTNSNSGVGNEATPPTSAGSTGAAATTGFAASTASIDRQLSCLQTCIHALSELEKSHLPTRRVRKLIQQAIRILDLDGRVSSSAPLTGCEDDLTSDFTLSSLPNSSTASTILQTTTGTATATATAATTPGSTAMSGHVGESAVGGAMLMADLYSAELSESWYSFDDFLPAGSQTDMLQSFESFLM